jgi:hypothetical protein
VHRASLSWRKVWYIPEAVKLFPYDRPATASEVLDAGFLLFRRTLPACLPWSLFAVLLGNLPSVYLLATGQSLSLLKPKDIVWWGLMACAALAGLWVWLFLLARQYGVARGGRPGLLDGAWEAMRTVPRAVAVILVAALALSLGTIFLVLPGIYLSVALWPCLTVLVAERRGVAATLDRALQLVRGSWWHTATILGVAGGVVMALYVVGILVGLLFAQVEGGIDRSAATLVLGVVSGLLAAIFQPLFVALGVAQYLDLSRREGGRLRPTRPPADASGIGPAAPVA